MSGGGNHRTGYWLDPETEGTDSNNLQIYQLNHLWTWQEQSSQICGLIQHYDIQKDALSVIETSNMKIRKARYEFYRFRVSSLHTLEMG